MKAKFRKHQQVVVAGVGRGRVVAYRYGKAAGNALDQVKVKLDDPKETKVTWYVVLGVEAVHPTELLAEQG